jgi:hypothetical protein
MPFCHLTQYCRSNTAVDIARILKVSSSPAGIKYKFGIQVPKGINNAIDLDKKNGNQLWQEAIKTELKQLTDYQTFIVLHSGEHIPTGYQKIPYHVVFDVKYELRESCYISRNFKMQWLSLTPYPDHSVYPVEDQSNWMELYPDASEEIPKDLLPEKAPRVRMTVYVEADHAQESLLC